MLSLSSDKSICLARSPDSRILSSEMIKTAANAIEENSITMLEIDRVLLLVGHMQTLFASLSVNTSLVVFKARRALLPSDAHWTIMRDLFLQVLRIPSLRVFEVDDMQNYVPSLLDIIDVLVTRVKRLKKLTITPERFAHYAAIERLNPAMISLVAHRQCPREWCIGGAWLNHGSDSTFLATFFEHLESDHGVLDWSQLATRTHYPPCTMCGANHLSPKYDRFTGFDFVTVESDAWCKLYRICMRNRALDWELVHKTFFPFLLALMPILHQLSPWDVVRVYDAAYPAGEGRLALKKLRLVEHVSRCYDESKMQSR